ncbi:50S ribosomal protein L9 [Anthocerotibacter panamensis]|uniref:50S ribosomal protein L9 n=1 Tax=Anthocerotibacter panamensis TaxID=2857077 RepID=UPI001C406AF0|nr:50S ribosomal protein L9 [Anthocerotibacter panamensis]
MGVKLILKQDVASLGQQGSLVEVAPGYARNYLLPRGLAEKATPGLIKIIEQRKVRERELQAQARLKAIESQRVLEGVGRYVIRQMAGESGQLFGSVTAQDIAEAVQTEVGFAIDRREITLAEEIRALGSFTAKVKLHSDVVATLQIEVIST